MCSALTNCVWLAGAHLWCHLILYSPIIPAPNIPGAGVLGHVILLSDVVMAVYGSKETNFDINQMIHYSVTQIRRVWQKNKGQTEKNGGKSEQVSITEKKKAWEGEE